MDSDPLCELCYCFLMTIFRRRLREHCCRKNSRFFIGLSITFNLTQCLPYPLFYIAVFYLLYIGHISRVYSAQFVTLSVFVLFEFVCYREVRSRLIVRSQVPFLQLRKTSDSSSINASVSVTATIYN